MKLKESCVPDHTPFGSDLTCFDWHSPSSILVQNLKCIAPLVSKISQGLQNSKRSRDSDHATFGSALLYIG